MEIECLISAIFYGVLFAHSRCRNNGIWDPSPKCHAETSLVAQRQHGESLPVERSKKALLRPLLPAQQVDATPSNQLILQHFPWRTDLFGCTRSKPSQNDVPADLTWRAILVFVSNAR